MRARKPGKLPPPVEAVLKRNCQTKYWHHCQPGRASTTTPIGNRNHGRQQPDSRCKQAQGSILRSCHGDASALAQHMLAAKHSEARSACGPVLCTRLPFLLHADCAHVIFLRELDRVGGLSLEAMMQKNGPKLKYTGR